MKFLKKISDELKPLLPLVAFLAMCAKLIIYALQIAVALNIRQ